jgi:hypothetical protein
VALLLACALVLPLASAARAVGPAGSAPDPWRLDDVLGLPERLSITGDFRIRYEYLWNQFRAGSPGNDQILPLRTRLRARLRLFDWLVLGAEFQDSRAYLADDDTPVGTGLVNAAALLRAYLEAEFTGPLGGHNLVQLGRVTMDVGSRRLVARNGFRNTSNAFLGLDWRWRNEDGRRLRVFFTLPVKRLPDDRDALVDNEVEFDETSADFQFAGLFFADTLPWGDLGELYLFGANEDRSFDDSDGDVLPRRRLLTPGFRLLREPKAGRFDYQLETVFQVGRSRRELDGSEGLEHFAHFHHLTLGYTFEAPGSPRLLFHYDYASGDREPRDDENQRFDTLFGGRRFEYGPSSIYGAFSRTNLNSPGVRLELRPGSRWTAFLDYRAVWLASDTDEWGGTGVRDPTGGSGSFVGQQLETRVRYRPFLGNVLLEAGFAHLFAGTFIDRAPNSNGGDTSYVYTQLILEF